MPTKREQKLIDIMFQVADASRNHAKDFKNKEEHMMWVGEQLSSCGFDTQPIGSSWGVLTK